jgi:hypothetical protein
MRYISINSMGRKNLVVKLFFINDQGSQEEEYSCYSLAYYRAMELWDNYSIPCEIYENGFIAFDNNWAQEPF